MSSNLLKLRVHGLNGARNAEYVLDVLITIFTGGNYTGKTTIIQALRACASQTKNPRNIDARKLMQYVVDRDGFAEIPGVAKWMPADEDGGEAQGQKLSSEYSVGLVDYNAVRSTAAWVACWGKILKLDPREAVLEGLKTTDLGQYGDEVKQELIETSNQKTSDGKPFVHDLDTMTKYATERSTQLKGVWAHITGNRNYSRPALVKWETEAGADIPPEKLTTSAKIPHIKEHLNQLKVLLAECEGQRYITAAAHARGVEAKGKLAAKELEISDFGGELSRTEAVKRRHLREIELAESEADATAEVLRTRVRDREDPEPGLNLTRIKELAVQISSLKTTLTAGTKVLEESLQCPECEIRLVLSGGVLQLPSEVDLEEVQGLLEEAKGEHDDLVSKYNLVMKEHRRKVHQALTEITDNCLKAKQAEKAKHQAELDELSVTLEIAHTKFASLCNERTQLKEAIAEGEGKVQTGVAQFEPEKIKSEILYAESQLATLNKIMEAAYHSEQVNSWAKAAKLLGPSGLRQQVIQGVVEQFNKKLRYLTDQAGYKFTPKIDLKGFHIELESVGKSSRPAWFGSGAEQLLTQVLFQSAIALDEAQERAEGEPPVLVVVDECDILDEDGRACLLALSEVVRENSNKNVSFVFAGTNFYHHGLHGYDLGKNELMNPEFSKVKTGTGNGVKICR